MQPSPLLTESLSRVGVNMGAQVNFFTLLFWMTGRGYNETPTCGVQGDRKEFFNGGGGGVCK